MFNSNKGVQETVYGANVQILFNVQMQMSVGVIVADDVYTVTRNGRKLALAGTPLKGSLAERDKPFEEATVTIGGDPDDRTVECTGVLLHDVDVTEGPNNGSLLIWGFVNYNRLDQNIKDLYDGNFEWKTEKLGDVTILVD